MIGRQHTERGIAVLMVVLMVNALLTAVALSVDIGRLRVAERSVQRMADVAALDAARFLSTPTATPDELIAVVKQAAFQSANRNQHVLDREDVAVGHLSGDAWHDAVPGTDTWPPTSVRVTGRTNTQWLFRPGGRDVQRRAVAELEPVAGFWLGSGLASLAVDDSPLLSSVMAGLVGSTDGRLDLVNWQSLAGASVTLHDLMLHAQAAGVSDYLDIELGVEDHLAIIAHALAAEGPIDAVVGLEELALALGSSPLPPVSIGNLLGLETPTPDHALAGRLGVLDLVHGLLLLGHAGGPAVEVDFEADLGPIARTQLEAHITEPPQYGFGPVGTSASTAQIDLVLSVEVPLTQQIQDALDHLLIPPLGGLLTSVLGPILTELGTLRVELALDAAASEATVTGISCPIADSEGLVTFLIESRLAEVTAEVLGTPVTVPLSGPASYPVSVGSPFGPDHMVTIPGPLPDIGAVLAAVVSAEVDALLGPLITGLLSPLLTPVTTALTGVLQPVTEMVHQQVMAPTLAALGITTATSYLTVESVGCQSLRLIR